MKRIYLSFSALLMFFMYCAIDLIAQPGTLDNSFGAGGKVKTYSKKDYMGGRSVLVQPDGKIIVAGGTYYLNRRSGDFTVVRYNRNGALDNSFSHDGIETTDFYSDNDYSTSAVLQPDGKIIIGGIVDSANIRNMAVARYNSNGTLDNTFSGNGKAIIRIFLNTDSKGIYDVVLQPDGKIVATGFINNDIAIIRLNSDGTSDMTFNSKGWITFDIAGGYDDSYSVALQADGKIVVAGIGTVGAPKRDFVVVRLNTDGTPDSTFSSDGKTTVQAGNNVIYDAKGLAIQTDSRIVIAGTTIDGTGSATIKQCVLIRLNDDGTLDSNFSDDGKLIHNIGSQYDELNDLLVQPDGKLLAIGSVMDSDFAIVRYNNDGTFDSTFNSTGIFTFRFGTIKCRGSSIALQPDNKIVVTGSEWGLAGYETSIAVARLFSGLETSVTDFENDTRIYPNPVYDYLHLDYYLSDPGSVSIQLTDMQGRIVLTVADNQPMDAGPQTKIIDIQSLASGIYSISITIQNYKKSYLVVH